jgi:hypothetical protein
MRKGDLIEAITLGALFGLSIIMIVTSIVLMLL